MRPVAEIDTLGKIIILGLGFPVVVGIVVAVIMLVTRRRKSSLFVAQQYEQPMAAPSALREVSMAFCSQCGKSLEGPQAKFCGHCGAAVSLSSSPPASQPVESNPARATSPPPGRSDVHAGIPASIIDELPPSVRAEVVKLPPDRVEQFIDEFRRKRKSLGIAYLLWFVLGFHYVYLGKWGLTLLQWALFFVIVGIVWWVIDAFRMPSMVENHNRDVASDVYRTLKMTWS